MNAQEAERITTLSMLAASHLARAVRAYLKAEADTQSLTTALQHWEKARWEYRLRKIQEAR